MMFDANLVLSVVIVTVIGWMYVFWPRKTEFTYSSTHPEAELYVTQWGREVRVYEQRTAGCIGKIILPFRCGHIGISRRGLILHAVDWKNRVHFYDLNMLEKVHVVPSLINVDFVSYDESDSIATIHTGEDTGIRISTLHWSEVLLRLHKAA